MRKIKQFDLAIRGPNLDETNPNLVHDPQFTILWGQELETPEKFILGSIQPAQTGGVKCPPPFKSKLGMDVSRGRVIIFVSLGLP